MKALIIFLFITIFNLCACAQTTVPKGLTWSYDYHLAPPPYNDPVNIVFDLYYSDVNQYDTFSLYVTTHNDTVMTIDNDSLYQNKTWHWFCRARCLSDSAISVNSNTLSLWFSKMIEGEPYNLEYIKMDLPE